MHSFFSSHSHLDFIQAIWHLISEPDHLAMIAVVAVIAYTLRKKLRVKKD
jgi:hypothetical protein